MLAFLIYEYAASQLPVFPSSLCSTSSREVTDNYQTNECIGKYFRFCKYHVECIKDPILCLHTQVANQQPQVQSDPDFCLWPIS